MLEKALFNIHVRGACKVSHVPGVGFPDLCGSVPTLCAVKPLKLSA